MNEITEDYAIIDGMKYTPVEQVGCKGCSFSSYGIICKKLKCGNRIRKDRKSVIWVEDIIYDSPPIRSIRLLKS